MILVHDVTPMLAATPDRPWEIWCADGEWADVGAIVEVASVGEGGAPRRFRVIGHGMRLFGLPALHLVPEP
jgi:hypothetical protein